MGEFLLSYVKELDDMETAPIDVEVCNREEGVLFTCFLVYSADGLAPCWKTGEVVIEYSVAFALPLFPSFQNGEIVQLFVVDAEEIVNALIGSVLGA